MIGPGRDGIRCLPFLHVSLYGLLVLGKPVGLCDPKAKNREDIFIFVCCTSDGASSQSLTKIGFLSESGWALGDTNTDDSRERHDVLHPTTVLTQTPVGGSRVCWSGI